MSEFKGSKACHQSSMKYHQPSMRRHAKRIKRHLVTWLFLHYAGDENFARYFMKLHNMQ